MAYSPDLSVPPVSKVRTQGLHLESTLQELSLYDFQIESSRPSKEVAKTFEANPLLPGVILTKSNQFAGMISRQRFLEIMSRPYGLALFLKRPLESLHDRANTKILMLPGDTLVVVAANRSLERPAELLNEPIVVELSVGYRLLDVHQLLVAQSQIHELTTKLLDEESRSKMLQTEKMVSLGRMVAEVAHEIKNPVNCINGNIEFLSDYYNNIIDLVSVYEEESREVSAKITEFKDQIELDYVLEDLPKILESIKVSAERLTKIVGGLQNLSYMDENKLQLANIHECIESTLLILNNPLKDGIEVIKKYEDLPPINCYSGQLSQVFMNIISNAIDALRDKAAQTKNWQPKIEITTKLLEVKDSEWVAIQIADNGPGIPPEIQKRIFETFFTTKAVGKGTGLGLAISNQIVTEKHGGKLLVRSVPEIGTEFEILLPLV